MVLLDVEGLGDDDKYEEDYSDYEDDFLSESNPVLISSGNQKKKKKSEIRVIATSTENFVSFQKPVTDNLLVRFLDSYRFLINSLSKLASQLDKSKMRHTRKYYKTNDEFEIASRKGVFP